MDQVLSETNPPAPPTPAIVGFSLDSEEAIVQSLSILLLPLIVHTNPGRKNHSSTWQQDSRI